MMASTVNSENATGISIFPGTKEMSVAFFDLLVDEFTQAISENRTYHLALSGGTTPIKIFQHLSRLPLAKMKWNFLHIYWGDERCVSPDNPESNFGNIWNTILKNMNIPLENIHRIHGENEPEQESQRYSEVLRKFTPLYNGLPRFDLMLLGIGDDGHTASIFPDSMEMLNTNKICYVALQPQTMQKRITLSLNVLNNSISVLFLVTGSSKAEVISKVILKETGFQNLPSAYIKPDNGTLKWFLDDKAGARLSI